jgi:hypothetical protein
MGVGYLSRVAGRGLPAAGSLGRVPGGPAKPAIASRSPVAEADQRLHLEDFADAFITAPEPGSDAIHGIDASLSDKSSTSVPADTPTSSLPHLPATTARRTAAKPSGDRRVSATTPAAAKPAARTGVDAYADSVEKDAAKIVPADAYPGRVVTDALTVVLADAPAAAPTVSQAQSVPAAHKAQSAKVAPAAPRAATGPVTVAPTEALTKRLGALERWLEGAPESQPSLADVRHAVEAKPVSDTAAPARSGPAYAPRVAPSASPEPQTRLEIGSIEVEVIAPPKAPVSRERRTPRRPARAPEHRSHTKPFGWRQR